MFAVLLIVKYYERRDMVRKCLPSISEPYPFSHSTCYPFGGFLLKNIKDRLYIQRIRGGQKYISVVLLAYKCFRLYQERYRRKEEMLWMLRTSSTTHATKMEARASCSSM